MAFATIGTKGIEDAAIATADIADDAVTSGKIASGVVPALRPNVNPLIINGDMAVAQRGTSKTSIAGGGYYTIDKFDVNNAGAFIGTWTQTQESLSSGDSFADGFAKSLKMDCTTANGSPAANSQCRLDYKFEGLDVQSLKHGTANAEKTTLSFWIKATKTGTNVVRMYKPDADRSCSQAYTVSTTNTWEKKVLNFPADTSGTVIANDNTMGLQMTFGIAMGSNNTSGTLQTTWGANTSANDYVGQVNNADSTSNNWEITGVQLEVGEYTSSTLPPFQHESFGDNLERCERYYQVIGTGTRADNKMYYSAYNVDGTSTMFGTFNFRTTMRAEPSLDQTSGTNYYTFNCNNASDDFDGVNGIRGGIHGTLLYLSGGSSVGSSNAGMGGSVLGKDASSHVALSAEL
tara:strand:- start:184 stop:1395 length:1212 start_codon:yes stop_codon:yes gene_type:complete